MIITEKNITFEGKEIIKNGNITIIQDFNKKQIKWNHKTVAWFVFDEIDVGKDISCHWTAVDGSEGNYTFVNKELTASTGFYKFINHGLEQELILTIIQYALGKYYSVTHQTPSSILKLDDILLNLQKTIIFKNGEQYQILPLDLLRYDEITREYLMKNYETELTIQKPNVETKTKVSLNNINNIEEKGIILYDFQSFTQDIPVEITFTQGEETYTIQDTYQYQEQKFKSEIENQTEIILPNKKLNANITIELSHESPMLGTRTNNYLNITVTDDNGNPLPNFELNVKNYNSEPTTKKTNSNGNLTLTSKEGYNKIILETNDERYNKQIITKEFTSVTRPFKYLLLEANTIDDGYNTEIQCIAKNGQNDEEVLTDVNLELELIDNNNEVLTNLKMVNGVSDKYIHKNDGTKIKIKNPTFYEPYRFSYNTITLPTKDKAYPLLNIDYGTNEDTSLENSSINIFLIFYDSEDLEEEVNISGYIPFHIKIKRGADTLYSIDSQDIESVQGYIVLDNKLKIPYPLKFISNGNEYIYGLVMEEEVGTYTLEISIDETDKTEATIFEEEFTISYAN